MDDKVYSVLFICTGNSARSIIAEAIMNRFGQGKFNGYSAGSHPAGTINPYTVETLKRMGISTIGLRSKSWNEFTQPGAPEFDFVFSVCDKAAKEMCPQWPGRPVSAHWGIDDPVTSGGSSEGARKRFYKVALMLKRRIELFMALPIRTLDAKSLREQLREVGQNSYL